MHTSVKTMSEKEPNLEKLMIHLQELQSEEEWLNKMISKLNDQAHALQVEQLHILNAMNKKSRPNTPVETTDNNVKRERTETQELDLRVPVYQSCEEDEDDEIED